MTRAAAFRPMLMRAWELWFIGRRKIGALGPRSPLYNLNATTTILVRSARPGIVADIQVS